jgi:fucose permease
MLSKKILFAYLSLFVLGFVDNARGPIYPLVIDVFNLSSSASSYIFSLASLVSFTITVVANLWLPRFGLIGSSQYSLYLHATALITMGISSFFSSGFIFFLMGCVFLGLAVGIQSITVNLIVSKDAPREHRRKIFSGLHAMYGGAALLAPLVVSSVIRYSYDWRVLFIALGCLLIVWTFFYKKPEEVDFEVPFKLSLRSLNPSSVRLGVLVAFYVSTEIIVATRLVLFLKRESYLSVADASLYLTGFFIFLLAGRLFFAFSHFEGKSENLLKVSLVFTAVFFVLAFYVDPRFLTLCGLSMSYFFPCSLEFITHNYKDSDTAISVVMNFVGIFLVFSHMVFGVITDLYGVRLAMYLGLILTLCIMYLLQRELVFLQKNCP